MARTKQIATRSPWTSQATTPSTSRKKGPKRQGSQKKPYPYKPDTFALRGFRHFLHKDTKLLIPTVRSIAHALAPPQVTRWTAEALFTLQEAAEDYLVGLFPNRLLCAIHAEHGTLMRNDVELARRLGGKGWPWCLKLTH